MVNAEIKDWLEPINSANESYLSREGPPGNVALNILASSFSTTASWPLSDAMRSGVLPSNLLCFALVRSCLTGYTNLISIFEVMNIKLDVLRIVLELFN